MKALMARSIGEVVIFFLAITICFVIIGTLVVISILEIQDSSVDTSNVVVLISDTINTLIGVMAGFLAGRSEGVGKHVEPSDL